MCHVRPGTIEIGRSTSRQSPVESLPKRSLPIAQAAPPRRAVVERVFDPMRALPMRQSLGGLPAAPSTRATRVAWINPEEVRQ